MNPDRLQTTSLSIFPHGISTTRIIAAALVTVVLSAAIKGQISLTNDLLSILLKPKSRFTI